MTKQRTFGSHHAMLREFFAAAGGIKRVTHLLDRKAESGVYAFHDPDHDSEITLRDVLKIAEFTGATQAAHMLAAATGGYFVPTVPDETPIDLAQIIINSSKEHSDFISALAKALSEESDLPGALTAPERIEVYAELDELITVLLHARAHLERMDPDGDGQVNHV